jgi:hypothetical protein
MAYAARLQKGDVMKKFVLSFLATGVAAAHAGGKIEPGVAQNPPRVADEADLYMELLNQGTDGYRFKAEGNVLGYAKDDRVRLDASQGGKVLASAKCSLRLPWDDADFGEFRCQYDGKPIKAKGKVDFDLVYEDDKTDKEYLARRFSVNVVAWTPDTWQIAPDDLLATAYADMQLEKSHYGDRQLRFKLWVAATNVQAGNTITRCTVDGKPIPDFETGIQTDHEIAADILKPKTRTTWHWQQLKIDPKQLHVGPREGDFLKDTKKEFRFLADNPGVWSCQIRQGGRAIRELTFTVDAKGYVQSHPMQQAKGAVPTRKGIALIDVKIPKDAMIDERIKPAELKKSRGFGLPWPQDASVKAIHAALPAAFENPAPKYVAKKGKRIPGYQHEPTRFIDEATTQVMVRGSGSKGYQYSVFAVVSGKTAAGDRFRLDWRQGNKVVSVGQCEWGDGPITRVTCRSPDQPLNTKGAHEADLVYEDDVDGNEYLLRTYKVNVVNPKAFGDPIWFNPADDALATAWARPGQSEDEELQLFFWVANEKGLPDTKLRCTVNGKSIPDIKVSPSNTPGGMSIEADVRPKQNAEPVEYYWQQFFMRADILTGAKASNPTLRQKNEVAWLIDNPGAWDCILRDEGKPIRQFLFTVNKDGYVDADPAQVDPAHPFLGKTVPIDARIPKDSKADTRLRGDAMKKSRGFGLPWPKPPTKPFPASSGLPDPK